MVFMDYKEIGDSLTTEEFNAIVSLLKHNKTLIDELEISNGAITGEYGTYTFDLESTTVVDNGILITDETLTSLGTVTLSNPVFNNATYTLHLTVISMEEPNILDDNKSETTTTDLTITLQKDTAVQIPFETLTNYCIIIFNASIEIKQDQPAIVGKYVTDITITGDKTVIQTNDTVNLTIKATDLDNIGVPNKTIKIYKNNTLWQTLTTDTNGEATVSYTGEGTGVLNIHAVHGSLVSETYSITDCISYDTGIDGTANEIWTKSTSSATFERDTDYSSFTSPSANALLYTGLTDLDNRIIEIDVWTTITSRGSQFISLRKDNAQVGYVAISDVGMALNTWNTVKIELNGTTASVSNSQTSTTKTIDCTDVNRFYFRVPTGNEIRFKNWKYY